MNDAHHRLKMIKEIILLSKKIKNHETAKK